MTTTLERLAWVGAFVLATAAAQLWRSGAPEPLPERDVAASADTPSRRGAADSLGMVALDVVANDPFRLSRRPSAVPYGSSAGTHPQIPAPRPIPELRLAGVVGPPWRAMLDGETGREGAVVVGVGDTLAGVRVRAIRAASVELSTPDTTWSLSMRRAWP